MGRARRNHYVPQFLLRRFASKKDGDSHWIWQISRDGAVREISTRHAAVAKDFYGDADTSIEATLSIVEAGYGGALADIDRGIDPASGCPAPLRLDHCRAHESHPRADDCNGRHGA